MREDVYERIIYIINTTKGSNIIPHRECFKVVKEIFPEISDYTLGSIYSLEYMRKMKQNHFKIGKIADVLHDRFNAAVEEGQPEGILLRMSDEIDLSPALLARMIVEQRYQDEIAKINEATLAVSLASPTTNTATNMMNNITLVESKATLTKIYPVNRLMESEATTANISTVHEMKDDTDVESGKVTKISAANGMLEIEATPADISKVNEMYDATLMKSEAESTCISAENGVIEAIVSEATPSKTSTVKVMNDSTVMESVTTPNKISAAIGMLEIEATPADVSKVNEMYDATLTKSEAESTNSSAENGVMEAIVSEAPPSKTSTVKEMNNSNVMESGTTPNKISVANGIMEIEATPADISKMNEMYDATLTKSEAESTNISAENEVIEAIVSEATPSKISAVKEINDSTVMGNETTNKISAADEMNEESSTDDEDSPTRISVTGMMKDPTSIDDPHLAIEAFLCTLHDDQYGPIADCVKHAIGQEYEMRLVRMARAAGLIFKSEVILRTTGFDKTPDVKLDIPAVVDGFVINWIESKALFGDDETHRGYLKDQYQCYWNRFGPGMVIYWFGFLEKIGHRNQDQFLIAEEFPKSIALCSMDPQPRKPSPYCNKIFDRPLFYYAE